MLTAIAAMAMAPTVFPLWTGDAPGALGKKENDVPTVTLFQPEKPCGTAIVVCPGGGYAGLADHEGSAYAKFLNRFGVTALVLKYRLGTSGYRHPSMLQDAERAVRFVRAHASEWSVDPEKVGIMGSSAGGHLASTLLTHWQEARPEVADSIDKLSSRPTFGILCYPVITMGEYTHQGSKDLLLGEHPDAALVDNLSNEKQVNEKTPPTFLWSTSDDAVVPVVNSLHFAEALYKNKVPFEIHVYPHGPHGLGLGGEPEAPKLLPWTAELVRWLRENGWAAKPASQ